MGTQPTRGRYGRVVTDLPLIDRPCVEVGAEPEAVWSALVARMAREEEGGPLARGFVAAIAARDRGPSGDFPEPGSTIHGFRVAAAEPPRRLLLEGRHRFSVYELEFEIEDRGPGRSAVCATTRAAFPGAAGRLYRAAVIGSRFHRLALRGMLGPVRARAERA